MFAAKVSEEEGPILDENENQPNATEKLLQRYTSDYSRWEQWTPSDPATKQEVKLHDKDAYYNSSNHMNV
jgi:hypothetical protein